MYSSWQSVSLYLISIYFSFFRKCLKKVKTLKIVAKSRSASAYGVWFEFTFEKIQQDLWCLESWSWFFFSKFLCPELEFHTMIPVFVSLMYWKLGMMVALIFHWLNWVRFSFLNYVSWYTSNRILKSSNCVSLFPLIGCVICFVLLNNASVKYQAKPVIIYTSTKTEESFLSALQQSGN